jgi:hypothetical protein
MRGLQLAAGVRDAYMIPAVAVVAALSAIFALQLYRETRWPLSNDSWPWAVLRLPAFRDAPLAYVVMYVLNFAAVVTVLVVFVGWLRFVGLGLAVLVIWGVLMAAHVLIRRHA